MDNEFWAAVVGAIVGSVSGGVITWLLSISQDRRQTSERNQALARSLIFKLIRITSDFHVFQTHAKECAERAEIDKLPIGWQSFRPIANLPDRISFSSEEMSYLLSLKNFELFDKVLSLDVLHSSTIGIFELYKERRLALTDMLAATMDGMVGTAALTDAQKKFFDPKAAELDLLVSDINKRVKEDAQQSRKALEETNMAISVTLGRPMKLKFKSDGESQVAA